MVDRILLAVDNSEPCGHAADRAIALAVKLRATLVGAHVYAARLHDRRFADLEPGLPKEFQDPRRLEASRKTHDSLIGKGLEMISDSYLDAVAARAAQADVRFERRSLEGKNHVELVRESAAGYGLTVIGAWGLGQAALNGQGSPHLLGSVCERVLRQARTDVWIVKDARPLGGTILVGVDGSPESYAALRRAINLAQGFGGRVEAASCYDPNFHPVAFRSIAGVLSEEAGRVFRFREQEAMHDRIINQGLENLYRGYLENAAVMARGKGFAIDTRLLEGKPAYELARRAKETEACLVVTARYGLHRTEGLDIGSTAEAVARLSPASVLVVNEEPEQATFAWTPDAEARLEQVPPFMRPMVRKAVESHARARGIAEITSEVVDAAKLGHGVKMPGH